VPLHAQGTAFTYSIRADRAAIERVYYNHRTGQKPPFEQALPAAALEISCRSI
jgi:hypothetical protein